MAKTKSKARSKVRSRARSKAKGEATGRTSTGLEPNVSGLLCYVLGWITGLVFLILEKNKFVRFHAIQSMVVFGAFTVVIIILCFIPVVGWVIGCIIGAIAFVLWIVLMVKAYQGEKFKLPVSGEIARNASK
jgi:uncharacterized membrane protein